MNTLPIKKNYSLEKHIPWEEVDYSTDKLVDELNDLLDDCINEINSQYIDFEEISQESNKCQIDTQNTASHAWSGLAISNKMSNEK